MYVLETGHLKRPGTTTGVPGSQRIPVTRASSEVLVGCDIKHCRNRVVLIRIDGIVASRVPKYKESLLVRSSSH